MSPVARTLARRGQHDRIRPGHLVHLAAGMLVAASLGDFEIGMVLAVFTISWTIEWLARRARQGRLSPGLPARVARFAWDFALDLARSNIKLAWDVLTPTDLHKVTLVRVPVDDLTPLEITFLCHRITLTPGTLACAVNPERTEVLVHMMYPVEGKDMGLALRRPMDILKGRA